MTVADFKARFSEVMAFVTQGESIQILYGRTKRPIAVISPLERMSTAKRVIGTYESIATFNETDEGKITEEEFLGL
ncbi:MAG: hypothetical protein IJ863_07190 [Spirochaetales bacterium]|nr:hypothetical protein [Spirochaetales bacterium]